jgi:DNA repair exonuclease SbcCD nuclease subunit
VTDTHLGIHKSSDLWHDITYNLFAEIHDFCIKNEIRTIIHLGDFFHDRKSLNTKTQFYAHKIAKLFETVGMMYIIVGNHDTYYKNTIQPNSLEFLKKYPKIRIVEEVTHIDELVLCPWGQLPAMQGGYCCGHFELKGFHMNNSYVCEYGDDPSILKGFDQVYSGHFHTPSTQGNVTYLGSAFPQTFHDVNSPRGFYVFNNGRLDFIEYKNSPKFIKVTSENFNEYDLNGNIVKLTFMQDYGNVENQRLIDEVHLLNPLKLNISFENIVEGADELTDVKIDESLMDHREIVTKFIDDTRGLPKNVKKNVLKQMILKLMGE